MMYRNLLFVALLVLACYMDCFTTMANDYNDPTQSLLYKPPALDTGKTQGALMASAPHMITCAYFAFVGYTIHHDLQADAVSAIIPAVFIVGMFLFKAERSIDNFCHIFAALSLLYIGPAYLFTGMIDFNNNIPKRQLAMMRVVYYCLMTYVFVSKWEQMRDHIYKKAGEEGSKGYAMEKLSQLGDKLDLFNKLLLLPSAFITTYKAFNKDEDV